MQPDENIFSNVTSTVDEQGYLRMNDMRFRTDKIEIKQR